MRKQMCAAGCMVYKNALRMCRRNLWSYRGMLWWAWDTWYRHTDRVTAGGGMKDTHDKIVEIEFRWVGAHSILI